MTSKGWAALAAAAAAAGCVAAGGGGGGGTAGVGGAASSPCDSTKLDEGCFGNARMRCDPAAQQWQLVEACGAGTFCTESGTPGGLLSMRKTECKASAASGGGKDGAAGTGDAGKLDADASSAGDGAVSDGGGTVGSDAKADAATDAGADVAQVDIVAPDIAKVDVVEETAQAKPFTACVTKLCSEEWSACGADPACIAYLACSDTCKDAACISACAQKGFSETTVLLAACATNKGCTGTTPAVCGNGKCEAGETASNCAKDCGGPAVCGNGKCEAGETKTTCPTDCGSPVCGNGICDAGETTASCSKDCAPACCKSNGFTCGYASKCGTNCGTCPSGQSCTNNNCSGAGPDCVETSCAIELESCINDDGCVAILMYGVLSNCAEKAGCTDSGCVQTNCGKPYSDCVGAPACTKLLSCLAGCKGDQACANKCPPPAALAAYQDLADCAQTNCP